jgi:hypothetical protein
LKWAEKKGFKTPEDMARALLQKEREFHDQRQKKEAETPPPPPAWNPQPQYGYPPANGYGYPPPLPQAPNLRALAARYPKLDPDDFETLAPMVADIAKAAAAQERARYEVEIADIRRTTARQNELMQLMQDPAFRDERVQDEIHAVLDADPTIFQRERNPHVAAFQKALGNMARKQLQQGTTNGNAAPTNMPPVTAGGGNGSAYTGPIKITEKDFARWSVKDQEAFINSNGRIVPKR